MELVYVILGGLLLFIVGRSFGGLRDLRDRKKDLEEQAEELSVPSQEEADARSKVEQIDQKLEELNEKGVDSPTGIRDALDWFNKRFGSRGR